MDKAMIEFLNSLRKVPHRSRIRMDGYQIVLWSKENGRTYLAPDPDHYDDVSWMDFISEVNRILDERWMDIGIWRR